MKTKKNELLIVFIYVNMDINNDIMDIIKSRDFKRKIIHDIDEQIKSKKLKINSEISRLDSNKINLKTLLLDEFLNNDEPGSICSSGWCGNYYGKINIINPVYFDQSSEYIGVSLVKDTYKWKSSIRSNGKQFHLGCFDNEEDAAIARDLATMKYFGDNGRLKFPIYSE